MISIFLYLLFGVSFVAGITGYWLGKRQVKKAEQLDLNRNVECFQDSIVQAKAIGNAIKTRSALLGSSNLSYTFKGFKKVHVAHAFDPVGDSGNKNTDAVLKGESAQLIQFIRICHSYGINIRLFQIGEKLPEDVKNVKDLFYTTPDSDLYTEK